MLKSSFQAVLEVSNQEEFRGEVIRFAQHLGFGTVSASAIFDRPLDTTAFVTVDNAPEVFRAQFESTERCRRDPVLQHCKHSNLPIVWGPATYAAAGAGEQWEEQAPVGFHSGICMALHLPQGRHFLCGVDLDRPLPRDQALVQRMTADLALFMVHAQESAFRVLRLQERPLLLPAAQALRCSAPLLLSARGTGPRRAMVH